MVIKNPTKSEKVPIVSGNCRVFAVWTADDINHRTASDKVRVRRVVCWVGDIEVA